MKLQSKIKVVVKGKIFGGDKVLECIPVVSPDLTRLVADVQEIVSHQPDVVEWRIDYFEDLDNPAHIVEAIEAIAPYLTETPLLLTFRDVAEGGFKAYSLQTRLNVIQTACQTGKIDLVDVEVASERAFLDAVLACVHKNGVKLVLSYHDFAKTPPEETLIEKMKQSVALGADIAKISIMPQTFADVLTVVRATNRARKTELEQPIISVSMSPLGSITRIMGGEIGTDLTFVCSANASGPGQVNIEDYRSMLQILHNN